MSAIHPHLHSSPYLPTPARPNDFHRQDSGEPAPGGLEKSDSPSVSRGPDAVVEISPKASAHAAEQKSETDSNAHGESKTDPDKPAVGDRSTTGEALSEDDQKQLDELKKRDAEVRQHEQAHLAAAGAYAQGGPSFSYQRGPDGRQYAVGGEVSIDTSPIEGDPQATIQKMEAIQRAATAPSEPSSQDRAVAAQAAQAAQQARQELIEQKTQSQGTDEGAAATAAETIDAISSSSEEKTEDTDSGTDPATSQDHPSNLKPPPGRLVDVYA